MYVLKDGAGEKGTELLEEVISAVGEQQLIEGGWTSDKVINPKRQQELVRHWSGSAIMARVLEGPAEITQRDFYEEEEPRILAAVRLPIAVGLIRSIGVLQGGYIEMSDKRCISLNMRGEDNTPAPYDFNPGLEIKVFTPEVAVALVH